jgi:predicted RNase H-like nuclease (RuvC/YqgF family)
LKETSSLSDSDDSEDSLAPGSLQTNAVNTSESESDSPSSSDTSPNSPQTAVVLGISFFWPIQRIMMILDLEFEIQKLREQVSEEQKAKQQLETQLKNARGQISVLKNENRATSKKLSNLEQVVQELKKTLPVEYFLISDGSQV